MPKNLIAMDHKRFTFDLVLWENFKIELEDRNWKALRVGPIEHTYKVRVGWLAVTVWVKKKPSNVGAYHDKMTPYLDLGAPESVAAVAAKMTLDPACVERWPGCFDGGYEQACCRFPKQCSPYIFTDERT